MVLWVLTSILTKNNNITPADNMLVENAFHGAASVIPHTLPLKNTPTDKYTENADISNITKPIIVNTNSGINNLKLV